MGLPNSIPVPQIRLGKRKTRSQMAEIFTDDGRIITTEISVLRGCMNDDKTGSAFLLDSDNQYTAEDGQWTQVLGERSTIPISMVKATEYKRLQKIINKIYEESYEGEILNAQRQAKKGGQLDKIMWLVFGPLSFLLIIWMITYFTR